MKTDELEDMVGEFENGVATEGLTPDDMFEIRRRFTSNPKKTYGYGLLVSQANSLVTLDREIERGTVAVMDGSFYGTTVRMKDSFFSSFFGRERRPIEDILKERTLRLKEMSHNLGTMVGNSKEKLAILDNYYETLHSECVDRLKARNKMKKDLEEINELMKKTKKLMETKEKEDLERTRFQFSLRKLKRLYNDRIVKLDLVSRGVVYAGKTMPEIDFWVSVCETYDHACRVICQNVDFAARNDDLFRRVYIHYLKQGIVSDKIGRYFETSKRYNERLRTAVIKGATRMVDVIGADITTSNDEFYSIVGQIEDTRSEAFISVENQVSELTK